MQKFPLQHEFLMNCSISLTKNMKISVLIFHTDIYSSLLHPLIALMSRASFSDPLWEARLCEIMRRRRPTLNTSNTKKWRGKGAFLPDRRPSKCTSARNMDGRTEWHLTIWIDHSCRWLHCICLRRRRRQSAIISCMLADKFRESIGLLHSSVRTFLPTPKRRLCFTGLERTTAFYKSLHGLLRRYSFHVLP